MGLNFLNTVAEAAQTTAVAEGTAASSGFGISSIVILVLMVAAFYFFVMRPQKKKEKEANERKNSIEVGDEITTIGGIVGYVVSMKEDTFVLETASDRSRLRFKRWAIQDVNKLELETGEEGEAVKSNKTDKASK